VLFRSLVTIVDMRTDPHRLVLDKQLSRFSRSFFFEIGFHVVEFRYQGNDHSNYNSRVSSSLLPNIWMIHYYRIRL
jgi:hypothetical protein